MVHTAALPMVRKRIDPTTGREDWFVRDADTTRRAWTAFHEDAPLEVLQALATDDDARVRSGVAANRGSGDHLLGILATDDDPRVRIAAGGNDATPVDVLITLASDGDIDVRLAVASNPSTPEDILNDLAGEPDSLIRAAVGSNAGASDELLTTLAQDTESTVRIAVAANAVITDALATWMATDDDVEVRAAARQTTLERRWGTGSFMVSAGMWSGWAREWAAYLTGEARVRAAETTFRVRESHAWARAVDAGHDAKARLLGSGADTLHSVDAGVEIDPSTAAIEIAPDQASQAAVLKERATALASDLSERARALADSRRLADLNATGRRLARSAVAVTQDFTATASEHGRQFMAAFRANASPTQASTDDLANTPASKEHA